ncbi:MAG TPA: hypothetical protein VGJ05_07890 [Fimbriiglobus sp.]|jgi:hypothetical protein
MLLHFPDLDTLRLAITSGLVPAEVVARPSAFSTASDGTLVVDSPSKFLKKTLAELKKLGTADAKHHGGQVFEVSCWPQILPAVRTVAAPPLSSQTPILFELPDETHLTGVVSELLRLGNDRQSFRWLSGSRVLLRVVGPPYYTLLRAIDRATVGGDAGVRAFAEAAPRVWVELGFSHPLVDRIAVAEGQVLRIREPRDWEYLPDEPYRNVYELLNLQLPAAQMGHVESRPEKKIAVPIRLVPGNAADEPEFWVLDGDPLETLDSFVRDADDRLVRRLRYAVAVGPNGRQSAILRVAPSKLAPPTLTLPGATGYRAYWKLPNLFVPAGTRLHPPLRRDAVRTLLASDPDAVVWLSPDGNGFVPRSIADATFRRLDEWVEYVIDREREPLAAWTMTAAFDFDSFVCGESAIKPTPAPPPREPRPERPRQETPPKEPTADLVGAKAGAFALPKEPKAGPPSEWKRKRARLEQLFLSVEGALDHPDRVKLWPELAVANAGAGDAAEAAACWSHVLWQSETPRLDWAEAWAAAELPDLTFPVSETAFDARLTADDSTLAEARQFVAVLLVAAVETPAWLKAKLPAARAFLDAHDSKLPARPAWLAAVALATLSGSDVLGLARSRDRLLQRLLDSGLNPDRDLPAFLRFAGADDADRMREVREKANELHGLVKAWLAKSLMREAGDTTATPAYADLLFAFAFAKFGDVTRAKELVRTAKNVLTGLPPNSTDGTSWSTVSQFLFLGFEARVNDALANEPLTKPLPLSLRDQLAELRRKKTDSAEDFKKTAPVRTAFYVIERMMSESKIFEPIETLDPYAAQYFQTDPLKKAVEALSLVRAESLPREVSRLLDGKIGTWSKAESNLLVLQRALPLAPRVGEEFTIGLLQKVPDVLTSESAGTDATPDKQAALLERALFFAGHFGRNELATKLIDRFLTLVAAQKTPKQKFKLISAAAGQGLRSLRKLGQKDLIDRMLQRLLAEITGGDPLDRLRPRYVKDQSLWFDCLAALLRVAGGWLTFGLTDRAEPIIELARAELLSRRMAKTTTDISSVVLARSYVSALGQSPAPFGLPRLQEILRDMPPDRILNSYTSAPIYSRTHFSVIEDVVLALTGDDFAIGPTGKKWLDEDEYLVRQRVHADVRRLLKGTGL